MSQSSAFENDNRPRWGGRIALSLAILFISSCAVFAQERWHTLTADTLETDSLQVIVTNRGMCFDWLASEDLGGLKWKSPEAQLVFGMTPLFYGQCDTGAVASLKQWESFSPGPLVDGVSGWLARPSERARYRTYRLLPGDADSNTERYNRFPLDLGAPFRNGRPCAYGSGYIWSVFNDADSTLRRSYKVGAGSDVEFRQTVIVGNSFPLADRDVTHRAVVVRLRALHRGSLSYDSAYLGFWLDVDIGDAWYDLFGIDTVRRSVFAYSNPSFSDYYFGRRSPALAFPVLQSPIRPAPGKQATALERVVQDREHVPFAIFYRLLDDSGVGNDFPITSMKQLSQVMHGRQPDGSPWIDPTSGDTVRIPLAGDPILRRGWVDEERRGGGAGFLFACGPFPFAPGDTQEIVLGVVAARGSDNLNALGRALVDGSRLRNYFNWGLYDCLDEFPSGEDGGDTTSTAEVYSFRLDQNAPNPFGTRTTISYEVGTLPMMDRHLVRIDVHDVLGRRIAAPVDAYQAPGRYQISWHATSLSSGSYFLRMNSGRFTAIRRMMLIR